MTRSAKSPARKVIVVGAGPVGLMLAGELRRGGADVVVYERLTEPARESRGASLTRRAVECFDQRGLLPRLGHHEPADSHFGGIPLDLGQLGQDHAGARGIPQYRTEEVLAGWALELGADIRRGYEVTGFEQSADSVEIELDGPDGAVHDEAAYLVGCDGGRSTIRTLAGVEFVGSAPTRGFYTADVTGVRIRRRRIGQDLPGGSMVMAMDLENGVTRVVVHEHGMGPRDRESLTFRDLADAWQRLTGESIHDAQCRWLNCFTDASRVAERYRSGRVFLAGDAAHVQPPAMAQGLSVGVQDAVNLGWKLAAAVDGWAPVSLLETYEAERLPLGRQLARNARAAIEIRLTGEEMDPVRGVIGELVARPHAARQLAAMLSGLAIRYEVGSGDNPLLGRRLDPDWPLIGHDGARTRAADLLCAGRGVLVTEQPVHAERARGWKDRATIVVGSWAADDADLTSVLIRPDGYVVWTSPGSEHDLLTALQEWFGHPH